MGTPISTEDDEKKLKDGKVEVMGINIDISQILGDKIIDQYLAQMSQEDIDKIIDGTYVPVPVQPSASLESRVRNVEDEIDNINQSNMKPNEIKEVLI